MRKNLIISNIQTKSNNNNLQSAVASPALRLCANPHCNKWFQFTNDAKKTCNTKCKNHKNYLIDSLEYHWEEMGINARRKNFRILEYLQSINRLFISREVLELTGFDFTVCYAPLLDENGDSYFRFGNSLLKQIDENNYELKYIDNEA